MPLALRRLVWLTAALIVLSGLRPGPSSPLQPTIVTADIDRFWQAYDRAQRDSAQAVAYFQELYFEPGSKGLQDFLADKILTVPRFVAGIQAKPRFYQSIRQTTLTIARLRPQIVANLQRLQQWYPPANFPAIYLVIGGYRSGGTVSPAGLLIGVDQVANGPGVDVSELTLVQRNRCTPVEALPIVVTHELIHALQQASDGSLLHDALNEGMADFIAGLVTDSKGANQRLFAYGDTHERALWQAFSQEMLGKDHSHWLANGKEETPEKPCDLGYYVGYKICEAYYQRAVSKKQAVYDMLHVGDATTFLVQSGYATQMATKP